MASRKTPLGFEGHAELGLLVGDLEETLRKIQDKIWLAYPTNSREYRMPARIEALVDELKNLLDAASSNELPEEQWSTRLYYGSREDREVAIAKIRAVIARQAAEWG
jgi:hypothetical protein